MAKKLENNLTQAQKNYLVKRINEISYTKLEELNNIRTGYGVSITNMGTNAIVGIAEGKIKLRDKASLMAELKSIAENANTSYTSLNSLIFVDMKSLEKFNTDMNKKAKDAMKAKQKRIAAVKTESDKLRDSVMLNGNLATELLEKFEAKKF